MTTSFIDPRDEAPALRRAALLLERVHEDGSERDSDFETLRAGIEAMLRAAAAGRKVHDSAIGRMEVVLARIAPPSCSHDASIHDIVRCNALVETRELLWRLARSRAGSESTACAAVQTALISGGIVAVALLEFFD